MFAEEIFRASQQQHFRYLELYGSQPIPGDRLRTVGDQIRDISHNVQDVRRSIIDSDFSTAVLPEYSKATADDHTIVARAAEFSDAAARSADTSANIITQGAQAIQNHATSEAAHVGAIPDPDSPSGLATVLATVAEHQARSTATVEQSSAAIVAAGLHAAQH